MNDQESPCSSWLLRTHFSRAVCHRPGTCTWLSPSPEDVAFLAVEKRKNDDVRKDLLSSKSAQDLGTSLRHNKSEGAKEAVDFSFPSPICSSTLSMLSESSANSKSTFDYFSPSSDDDTGANSVQSARRSWSDSNSLFTSMLNTVSSRWSVSSDSFKGNQEHPTDGPLKGSWFSWLFSKTSPKSSPKVSPTASPRGSPRSLFHYNTNTRDCIESDRDDSTHSKSRSDIQRAPSWSQHLFHSGNERAVLSAEKWMVDLSQLFLGERFACGSHSRLYRGKYRDNPVAVKVIRQPDADGLLADRLDQIFTNEVTMLSILKHRNVIEDMRPPIPADCPPALEDLMRSCWSTDPKERPEFWEIMRSLTLCMQSLNTSEIPTLESSQHYSSMPSWLRSE